MPKFNIKHSFTFDPSLASFDVSPSSFKKTLPPDFDKIAVGAFVYRPESDHLLLIRRANHEVFPGVWEVPGGGVENRDATILTAAAREVFEETGLTVAHFVKCIDHIQFRGSTGRRWRKYNFEVEIKATDNKTVKIKLDPYEHQDWKWATSEEFTEGSKIGGWASTMLKEAKSTIAKAFEERGQTLDENTPEEIVS